MLNYSENNEIFVAGVFFWPHPVDDMQFGFRKGKGTNDAILL